MTNDNELHKLLAEVATMTDTDLGGAVRSLGAGCVFEDIEEGQEESARVLLRWIVAFKS